MIFFDLFVFLCFLPAKSFAQDLNPEYAEVLITLRVSDMGNSEIPTIIHNKEIYLPIIDIFNFLKIKCLPTDGLDSISGFFINQNDNYLVDRINNRIIYKENIFNIEAGDLIRTETNLYLKSNYFGKIFGLECTFNFRSLSVSLKSKFELPIIREMRIEQMRLNINHLKKKFKADTTIGRNYPLFHFGTADWSINTTHKINEANNNRLNLSMGAILAGGEFNGRINYNNNAPISNRNLFYRWRYADNNKKIVRQIMLGRIGTQSISTIYNPVSGLQITNSPTINRKSFGTYVLSDHTEPGWIVELYVNNVLIDYVKADASGFFTFNVPLIYGNTDVTLHYYGPWGEEKISEQNHKIPYDFLPKNKIEYTISSGIVEDDENSIFSQARMNYGLSRHITVGGGFEYLSSISNSKGMPFFNTSIRLAPNILFTGEYTYGVNFKGMLTYNLPSNFNFSLNYTNYDKNQKAVINNYKEELRAMISKRFHILNISTFSQLTIDHHTVGSLKLTNSEFVLSGSSHGVNVNLTTYAYFMGDISTSINSKLALSTRLPANIMLKSQVRYDYKNNNLLSTRCGLEKHLFRHCFVNTSFVHNFNNNTNYFNIGLKYDFSFARINSSVSHSNNTTTFTQSASGSLIYEAKTNYLEFNKNSNVGKGGLIFLSFLDINNNGKRDKDEPKLNGLNIRVHGGGITKKRKDSTIVVLGLEPYIDYFVELNANSFEYIAWKIKKKTLNIAINPNQLRLIEVPVSVLGEVSGMVYIKKENEQKGIGRIKVCFYNSNSILVASTLTETDGYFYYLGLGPGSYTVKIDSNQLNKLKMTVSPDGIPITILPSEDGDIVDGLDFVLSSNKIKTEEKLIEKGMIYTIQFAVSESYVDPAYYKKKFKLADVWYLEMDGIFRYLTGKYITAKEAMIDMGQLDIKGFVTVVDLSKAKVNVPKGEVIVPNKKVIVPKEKGIVPNKKVIVPNEKGMIYTIQLAASKSYVDPAYYKKKLKLYDEVWYFEKDGYYKYVTGKYLTKKAAKATMALRGIKGFITVIDLSKAKEKPNKKVIVPNEKGMIYTIQLAASKSYVDPAYYKKKLKLYDEVWYFEKDGYYKYVTGKYLTKKAAKATMALRGIKGFITVVDLSKAKVNVPKGEVIVPNKKVIVPNKKVIVPNEKGMIYTIQLAASKSYVDPAYYKKKLKLYDEVWYFEKDGYYKYVTGEYLTKKAAKAAMALRGIKGFITVVDLSKIKVKPKKKVIVPNKTNQLP